MKQLFAPWRRDWVQSSAARDEPASAGECMFCRVWRTPADDVANLVVHRGAGVLVMLNRYPYNGGHLLVAPEEHQGGLELLAPATRASLMETAARAMQALSRVYQPDGFNLGVNQGRAAGAGLPDHVHLHIVPRWAGDTNFLATVGETRVVSDDLVRARRDLAAQFEDRHAP